MNAPELPARGACRCGAIEIEVTAPPMMTAACHCTGCQRMSASAYSLTAMFPNGAFRVTKGEPVLAGERGPQLKHYGCGTCMSWMFTRIEGFDDVVNVRPTLFDDTSWFVPFIETMTKEKLGWADTPAVHRFPEFPPVDEFRRLVGEFATTS